MDKNNSCTKVHCTVVRRPEANGLMAKRLQNGWHNLNNGRITTLAQPRLFSNKAYKGLLFYRTYIAYTIAKYTLPAESIQRLTLPHITMLNATC